MTDSVSPKHYMRKVAHINAMGYTVMAGVALLMLPLAPFIAVLYVLDRFRPDPDEGPA